MKNTTITLLMLAIFAAMFICIAQPIKKAEPSFNEKQSRLTIQLDSMDFANKMQAYTK